MAARQLLTALVFLPLAAVWFREWKEMRRVQDRARSILYPGDPDEMAEVLRQLRWYTDPESQALARQLEKRLRKRGRRGWRPAR